MGIIRRIDDLGRIVIPKEIRRILRIREGEPLEIRVQGNTLVISKPGTTLDETIQLVEDIQEKLATEDITTDDAAYLLEQAIERFKLLKELGAS